MVKEMEMRSRKMNFESVIACPENTLFRLCWVKKIGIFQRGILVI